jgi:hypothetical protein
MDLDQIIAILENRLKHNARQREMASQRGDLEEVARLDADTATTQSTLESVQGAANPPTAE